MNMAGYTKLFNSILHSTIWSEPHETRILWITMLAMSDRNGCVNASIPGLARMAGVSIDQCKDGIQKFLSPDPYSRTPDNEGRRIEQIDGGWHLLNHGKYREMMSLEERREYNRRKQAERRAKLSTPPADMSMTVNDSQQCQHIADTDTDTDNNSSPAKARVKKEEKSKEPTGDHAKFIKLWTDAYPEHHDDEKYVFQAGKDAAAVKQLLQTTGKTPEELMDLAIYAWKNQTGFYVKHAAAIASFNSQYTHIREECRALHRAKQTNGHAANGTAVPAAFQVPMNPPPQRPAHLDR